MREIGSVGGVLVGDIIAPTPLTEFSNGTRRDTPMCCTVNSFVLH
jgi:hypothetical protein